MKKSKCVGCGNDQFEMVENRVMRGTDRKWFMVQCVDCGGVAGVVDFFPHGELLRRLDRIEKRLRMR